MGNFIKNAFIIFAIVSLMFVGLNIAAYYYVTTSPKTLWNPSDNFHSAVIAPNSTEGHALLQKLYGEQGNIIYEAYNAAPYFAPHPTLHYIVQNTSNEHYRIGVEGIRYQPGWNDEYVKNQLLKKDNIYIFGGSTVMGHGLSHNQTLATYMQSMLRNPNQVVFNFGAQAYDQTRELDKLIYLLRHGYRPKTVVFLDGLNDIIGMSRSNYRALDKIVFHGYAAGKGDFVGGKAFKLGNHNISKEDFIYMLTTALPIYQAVKLYFAKPLQVEGFRPEKDPFMDSVDMLEAEIIFFNWAQFGIKNLDLMQQQTVEYYQNNLEVLDKLSKAFGFKYVVFYQPIGMIDPNNPFVRPEAATTDGAKYYNSIDNVIRDNIANKKLNMVDISSALKDLSKQGKAYIDGTHYSPTANQMLAEIITAKVERL